MSDLQVYDTTLRDGAQQEGLNLSVADKLTIARHLDDLGVGYVEGAGRAPSRRTPSSSRGPGASCGCSARS